MHIQFSAKTEVIEGIFPKKIEMGRDSLLAGGRVNQNKYSLERQNSELAQLSPVSNQTHTSMFFAYIN